MSRCKQHGMAHGAAIFWQRGTNANVSVGFRRLKFGLNVQHVSVFYGQV